MLKEEEYKKIIFNKNFFFSEKDFSSFDMRFLKDKDRRRKQLEENEKKRREMQEENRRRIRTI